MTSSCNWDNRVKRAEPAIVGFGGKLGPIQSDGKLIRMLNESKKTGAKRPVTGHEVEAHTFTAEYEHATYVWDDEGTGRRIPRSA